MFIDPDNVDSENLGELYLPDYQREYRWDDKIASRFIESILIGFPIPYLFISSVESDDEELDGRVEVIDGGQRIRTLKRFVYNQLRLSDLKEITELNGLTFADLSVGTQRRFKRTSLRLVELLGDVESNESMRRDLFERINTGTVPLNEMEKRRGSTYADSDFYKKVLKICTEDELFQQLAPLSDKKAAGKDREELVLRFFAYSESLEDYSGKVAPFLNDYLESKKDINDEKELQGLLDKFNIMLRFVEKNFPDGFKKTGQAKTTYRTFFEAIAIGSALAIAENPNLSTPKKPVFSWLFNDEFKKIIASDSANNTSKLKERIYYVKDKLLEAD